MDKGSMARIRRAAALGLVTASLTTAAGAASSVAAPGACVVVLECPGVTQKVVPDADGKFVFKDAPAGACTVSVVEAPPAAERVATAAPRDAASGQASGKRAHRSPAFQVSLDGAPVAARAAAVESSTSGSVSVVLQERRKELTGHVTLIK